jgi:hypothetical protein
MAGWAREILAKITTVNETVTAFADEDRCRQLLEGRCQVGDPSPAWQGVVQLDGGQAAVGTASHLASHGHWNSGHIVPCAQGGIASRAMVTGRQAMTAKLKVVVNPAMVGEETLRVTG